MRGHTQAHMHTHMYACTHPHTYAVTHTLILTHTHAHMCTHHTLVDISTCKHTHAHTHVYTCVLTQDFLSLLPSVSPTLLSRLPCLLCSYSVRLVHNVFVWCLPPSHDTPTNMAVSAPTFSLLTLLLSGTLGISAPYQVHLSTRFHRLEMHRNAVLCISTCSHFFTETLVSRVLMPFS